MTMWATILMVVIFPLNSLLVMQEIFSVGEKTDFKSSGHSIQAEVKGLESSKSKETKKPKAQAVDYPEYQPTRKDGIKDLVVPGAHASVVIDADTGTVLHDNNGKQQRQIASLTKIMTALLVLEKVKNLDEEVTIDEEAIYADGTKIGCPRSGFCNGQRLMVGEKISARNLLEAALLNSANDAAIALGKHISGSQDAFAELMNKRAKELGLIDSNFCTPSGLEPDGRESECYSSAYDIAKITAYSLRYDEIWRIFNFSPDNPISICSTDGKTEHDILNTVLNIVQIPNALGCKTGFTPLAGRSLLAVVSDSTKKHRVVAVVLDDNTRWQDVKNMTSWAFDSYVWKHINKSEVSKL